MALQPPQSSQYTFTVGNSLVNLVVLHWLRAIAGVDKDVR